MFRIGLTVIYVYWNYLIIYRFLSGLLDKLISSSSIYEKAKSWSTNSNNIQVYKKVEIFLQREKKVNKFLIWIQYKNYKKICMWKYRLCFKNFPDNSCKYNLIRNIQKIIMYVYVLTLIFNWFTCLNILVLYIHSTTFFLH